MKQPPSGESRMDRKKEETRQKILAAAMQMFREQSFDAVSMETIPAKLPYNGRGGQWTGAFLLKYSKIF